MKTLFKHIVFFTILSISFFNCSKDDDDDFQTNEPTTQQLLIGKWNYDILHSGEATACEAQTFYQFLDSENVIYQFVKDDVGIAFGEGEVIGDCFYSTEANSTYTILNDRDINIVHSYGILTLKIISINDTTLVITRSGLTGVETIILTKEF